MPPLQDEQSPIRIGVDVGGTFTDLVAFDGRALRVVKVPSTPPGFHEGVIRAVNEALSGRALTHPSPGVPGEGTECAIGWEIVHGSTVATNALLQRAGEAVAFITTEGFRDMLLIGRQNRPRLYDLRVRRPASITGEENWFTVRERIDARGRVIEALEEGEVRRVVETVRARGLRHAAVCLLFSFVNDEHERRLGAALSQGGITVSLSCDVLPEFREYERASTTAVNASLRPVVEGYLAKLEEGLRERSGGTAKAQAAGEENRDGSYLFPSGLRIMHGGGGTLDVRSAGEQAARLVLSGPAGGVLGAAFVARRAGYSDIITYDMGGTSTDVATIVDGRPQWTTASVIDGLPVSLPMFDIHTVGAGGGSIAYLDAGGALRVGPRSAGASPGPACYGRGGEEPTVTDANLVLGRIVPEHFLGGRMKVEVELAREAVARLAGEMYGQSAARVFGPRRNEGVIRAALGILRIAEANMAQAIRAVTARRGFDPRQFVLVSFGGAGGLHACALAEGLQIPRVVVPPYCGVLSALGMVVAPAVVDVSQTVLHLGEGLDDARLAAEYGRLNLLASEQVGHKETAAVEAYADVRFTGQSHEVKVRVDAPTRAQIGTTFREAYERLYGTLPSEDREIEIVTLRLRRVGREPAVELPEVVGDGSEGREMEMVVGTGEVARGVALTRAQFIGHGRVKGPALVVDAEATTYVPEGWNAEGFGDGSVVLVRQL